MIDIMFIGQNVGIFGCYSEQKHQYKHFWTQESVLVKKWGKINGPMKMDGSNWR